MKKDKIDDNSYYAIVSINHDIDKIYSWYQNKVFKGKEVLDAYEKMKHKVCYKIYRIDLLTMLYDHRLWKEMQEYKKNKKEIKE